MLILTTGIGEESTLMQAKWSTQKERVYAVLYFVAIVLVFFREPLLFPLHFHIPYDLDGYHYPLTDFIAWSLREFHQLPWWNPYSYMGQPFFGNVQAAMFYPPTLVAAIAGNAIFGHLPFYFLELQLAFHVVLAGLGTYLLLRLMCLTVASSLAGGTIYCLGAFFASQTQHLGVISCAAWLPWFVAGLYVLEQRRDLRSAAKAGGPLAFMILSGFPAGYLPALIVGPLLYGLWAWKRHPYLRTYLHVQAVVLLAVTVIIAVLIGAVSWLPGFQIGRRSVATLRPLWQALDGVPPEAATSFFWPNLFGQLGTGFHVPQSLHLQPGTATFLHLYQSIPALLLVLGAASWLIRSRKARPYIAGVVLTMLWMFGRAFPVSEAMYLAFPSFVRRALYPLDVLAYFCLCFATLAAISLDGYERSERKTLFHSRICWWAASLSATVALIVFAIGTIKVAEIAPGSGTTLLWIAGVLACCGLLVQRRTNDAASSRSSVSFVLCALIFFDLVVVGSSTNLNTANSPFESTPKAVEFLHEQLGSLPVYRIDTTGLADEWQTRIPEWRTPSANGFDPLLLLDTATYREPFSISADHRQFSLKSFHSPMLNLAGVRYIAAPDKDLPGYKLVHHSEVNIFENPLAFPRFFLVGAVTTCPDIKTAVNMIESGQVDPARVAVVPVGNADRFAGLPGPASTSNLGKVQLTYYSPNRLRVRVEAQQRAVLVATETFWQDWRATVDGSPQPITRADAIFRAVVIPPGVHDVTMFIVPTALYAGATISGLGLLLALGFIYFSPSGKSFASEQPVQ
jgi:hypothetical protein